MSNFKHAVIMFNGAANMARAIDVHRAAVSRWENGSREILPHHQLRIIQAGIDQGMDVVQLAWAIGVKRCKCCDEVVDDEIRELMHEHAPVNMGKRRA